MNNPRAKETLSFEIQESPVMYDHNGQVITSSTHKVISKVETGESLSVMKNSYNPMYNSDFIETVERMRDISGFELSGYSEIDSGRIVFAHLKNNGEFTIGKNNDRIEDYLLLGSSFDGRYPFFIGTTTEFMWCKNQFSKISKLEKVRHTKSAPKRREELMVGLEIYFQNKKRLYENFEKMSKVIIDPLIVEMAKNYVLNISKEDVLEEKVSTRKLNQLEVLSMCMETELSHFGNNALAVFNGVTRYTSHELTQKEKSFGNIFGTPALLNNRAYEYALSL